MRHPGETARRRLRFSVDRVKRTFGIKSHLLVVFVLRPCGDTPRVNDALEGRARLQ